MGGRNPVFNSPLSPSGVCMDRKLDTGVGTELSCKMQGADHLLWCVEQPFSTQGSRKVTAVPGGHVLSDFALGHTS